MGASETVEPAAGGNTAAGDTAVKPVTGGGATFPFPVHAAGGAHAAPAEKGNVAMTDALSGAGSSASAAPAPPAGVAGAARPIQRELERIAERARGDWRLARVLGSDSAGSFLPGTLGAFSVGTRGKCVCGPAVAHQALRFRGIYIPRNAVGAAVRRNLWGQVKADISGCDGRPNVAVTGNGLLSRRFD
jgi:hypothetical protein